MLLVATIILAHCWVEAIVALMVTRFSSSMDPLLVVVR